LAPPDRRPRHPEQANHRVTFSPKTSTLFRSATTDHHHAMLPAVIVLLLLTALVATDSVASGTDEK